MATAFALEGTVGGFTDVSIATVSKSQGGVQHNLITQLDLTPLQFQSQNRAVTVKDYETLTKDFILMHYQLVHMGEGIMALFTEKFLSVFLNQGATLTENSKLNIVNNLKKYNLASVTLKL